MAKLLRCRFCVLAMESVSTADGAVLVCMECAPAEGDLAVTSRGGAWHGIAGRAVLMSRKRAEVRRGGVKQARKRA